MRQFIRPDVMRLLVPLGGKAAFVTIVPAGIQKQKIFKQMDIVSIANI